MSIEIVATLAPTITPELATVRSITSRKSDKCPHRVTLHLSEEAMTLLETEMATIGYSNADALVERLLRDQVERRKREEKRQEEAERIVTTYSGRRVRVGQMRTLNPNFSVRAAKSQDGAPREPLGIPIPQSHELFRIEDDVCSPACEVSVHELRGTSMSGRLLLLQNFYKDSEGVSGLRNHFVLSRTSIPWLISALQQAETAIEAQSARNRKKAHEIRAARSPEEVAHDLETKRAYTERYSKEKVTRATTLATRHRSRARRIDLKDHFTAWQWLDLCARSDFRCDSCGALAKLEPHHIQDLSAGGANTIENIQPLCRCCHRGEQLEPHELAELWSRQQRKFYESFHIGERVKNRDSPGSRHGTILELFEPLQDDTIPRLWMPSYNKEKEVALSGSTSGWANAKALVAWSWGNSVRKTQVDLATIIGCEDDETHPET